MRKEPYRYLFNVAKEAVEVVELPNKEPCELILTCCFFGLSAVGQVALFTGALTEPECKERFNALGQVGSGDLIASSNTGPTTMIIPEYMGPVTIYNPIANPAHIGLQLRTLC